MKKTLKIFGLCIYHLVAFIIFLVIIVLSSGYLYYLWNQRQNTKRLQRKELKLNIKKLEKE